MGAFSPSAHHTESETHVYLNWLVRSVVYLHFPLDEMRVGSDLQNKIR